MKQIKFLTPVILSLILVVSFASCDKYSKVKAEIQIFQDSLSNPDWYKKTILFIHIRDKSFLVVPIYVKGL